MEAGRTSPRVGNWRSRLVAGLLVAALSLVLAPGLVCAEKVKMSTFQANLCCFTVYVAKHLKLFEKHGVADEALRTHAAADCELYASRTHSES
jgi:hypothetical protein